MRSLAITLALALCLAACAQPGGHAVRPGATAAPVPEAAQAQLTQNYSSPFAYCRAVGTADKPGAHYTGTKPPPAVVAGLVKALGISPEGARSPAFLHGIFWRCMDGAVYACSVGANLPCESKANTDRAPTAEEQRYCEKNHDALLIPMYVTGHNTIFDWRCEKGKAVAGRTLAKVDKRGYIADIWYRIPPPNNSP